MPQQYSEPNITLIACMFGITLLVLIGVFVRILKKNQKHIRRMEVLDDLHEAMKEFISLIKNRSVDPSEWGPAEEKLFARYEEAMKEAEAKKDEFLILRIKDKVFYLGLLIPSVEEYEIMARKLK